MSELTVAIIDTGLDKLTYDQNQGLMSFSMVKSGKVVNLGDNILQDFTSHGGLCLNSFELASNFAADYFILLESDDEGKCNVNDLTIALEWGIDNGASVISLSMGTTQYSDSDVFDSVMKRIAESGICLIAGANNNRHLSFPACLESTIGVCIDYTYETVKDSFAYIEDSYDGIEVVLNPKTLRDGLISSNSMATAYFSGLVAKTIRKGETTPSDVRKWIADNAGSLSPDSAYEYMINAIMHDVTEEIVVVGIDRLSSDESVSRFCHALQDIFLHDEYHCVTIIPKCGIEQKSDFSRHMFIQPLRSECSYVEYIEYVKKLCKPNLILVNLESGLSDYDVVVCNDDISAAKYSKGDTLVIDLEGETPKSVFTQIVNHYGSES